jgi:hypothetical protein
MHLAMTAYAVCFASLGCAPTGQLGLANAPGLGGTRIGDTRVHDVISNGPDSCGRRLEPNQGPLRYRLPPCQSEAVPGTTANGIPPVARDDAGAQRWMKHYYFGWPCKARHGALAQGEVLAWSPELSAAWICGVP